jgi:lipopolysaccharide heptosyltransferase II
MSIQNQNSKVKSRNYKKILIVRLDRIGDVVLSTPVIKAVREAYPASHIAFLVRPYAEDAVKGNPYLDEVITYDKKGTLKFILKLARKRFELAIILHPTSRTHWVTLLACIPERVGYDKKMGTLLTDRIPHKKELGLKHEVDYTLDILEHIGIAAKDRALYFPIKRESEKKVRDIFARGGIRESDAIVVLNPSASCPSKRWRPESFANVGDAIAERLGAKIVIISDLKDRVFADQVANAMRMGSFNIAGMTTVADLGSVLKRAKLFISNDSGPVHIACAVGTPVIAIFGRKDAGLSPKRWGPRGKRDIVLHKDVGCDVCLAHNCNIAFKCLEEITPEEVISAAATILKK